MNLDSFTGPGSTPSRRRFWDKVTQAVNASQKIEGDNVTVTEHQGQGSLIDVAFSNRGRPGPNQGACCDEENNCTISTEEDCAGTFQGAGTVCDPNPCGEGATGACCIDGECSILSESDCTDGGGNYLGDGSVCEGVDCTQGACCFDTSCSDYPDQETCEGDGGIWKGAGNLCEDGNPCNAPTGACCYEDGSCAIVNEANCTGHYQGDDTTCEESNCVPFLPDCPTTGHSLFVDFTGITVCGCRTGLPGTSRRITSITGLGSGTLSWTGSQWEGSFGSAHWEFFTGTTTCTGAPTSSGDSTPHIIIQCAFGNWVIVIQTAVEVSSVDLFHANPTGFPLEVDDDGSCGGSKYAHNGHVSITVI